MKVSRFEKDNFFPNKKTFQDTLNREILTRFGFFFQLSFQVNSFMGNEPNFFELADKVVKERKECPEATYRIFTIQTFAFKHQS